MAEGQEKKCRFVSGVGLTLFHAIGNMAIPLEPDGLAKGEGEMYGRNISLPASDGADDLERDDGAVDATGNGSKGSETGKSANLVSRKILTHAWAEGLLRPSLKYIYTGMDMH